MVEVEFELGCERREIWICTYKDVAKEIAGNKSSICKKTAVGENTIENFSYKNNHRIYFRI